MLRYHMVVVTKDNALKRAVKRVTTSTGSTADFITDATGFVKDRPPGLVIVDARTNAADKALLAAIPADARILYIIEGDQLISQLPLVDDPRATSLFCHDAQFDDDEFISSATKALRGEVFGLQKYFPWGVTTFTAKVKSHEDKGRAIELLMEYATLAGCRGPVRDRIQLVADELMMNALFHAPVDETGKEKYAGRTLKELAQLPMLDPVQVQYGCSGRYFGLSVRDGFGSLDRKRLLAYLKKANAATMEQKASGAGLGLISVLKSVSKLIFNVEEKSSAEVIALFDMELFAKGRMGARSLHLFTVPPAPPEEAPAPPPPPPGLFATARGWAMIAVLLVIVSTMGTAFIMKNTSTAKAQPPLPATTCAPPVPAPAHDVGTSLTHSNR